MFELISIQFSTPGRLLLVFNETVDPTNVANVNPLNYVISGDAQVAGNFAIAGSTISFDIALARVGVVYDITVSNLVSSQGHVIAPPNNRLSFYYGIGVITPFLVNTVNGLGSLYIISDSALVGMIAPSGETDMSFGTERGQSVITSYNEILDQIPPGGWYLQDLVTIPYQSGATDYLFITPFVGALFGFYVNNVLLQQSTSNWQGWVSFQVPMPAGSSSIKIFCSATPVPFPAELVDPRYVTWVGGLADTLGVLDSSIAQVSDSRSIERVRSDDIEANFGAFLQTSRVSNYSLEVYRELLIEVFRAFRYYAGALEGLFDVIAAFTQVRPLIKWMRDDAPRWILAWQHLKNREMTKRFRYAKSSFPFTNIIATSCSGSNENGTANIFWDSVTSTIQYKSVPDVTFGTPVDVTGPGTYTAISANGVDSVTVQISLPTPGAPITIPIVITGPTFPEDVIVTNATLRITSGAFMQVSGLRIKLTATGANPIIALIADPTTFKHLGEFFVASFWVKQTAGALRHFVTEISEDGGATWLTGAPVIAVPDDGNYHRVTNSQSVGYFGITDIRVRLRATDIVATESYFVEKACLHSPQTGALYLSKNTIARSRRRKFFGYQVLTFLREALEQQAWHILGVSPSLGWGLDPWSTSPYGSPTYGFLRPILAGPTATNAIGLINYIVPTITDLNVFQDSINASDNSGIVNVRGVIYEADWRAGTFTNLDVIPRTPDRFTYLLPAAVTSHSETVVFNGSNIATLNLVSIQDLTASRLLQDGVPVPNTEWNYTDSTHIQLTSPADPTSVYRFDYNIKMAYQSATIDLGVKFDLFNWYADWYEYIRDTLEVMESPTIEPLTFSSNTLLATLPFEADTTASNSALYKNNGQFVTQISTTMWRFIDASTVKIDPSVFDPLSTYSITYTAKSLLKKAVANSVVQIQYSTDNLTFSPWTTIPHDAPFGNRFRYFKFKIDIFNVLDLRDYKLRSLVLKGDPLDRTTIKDFV